MILSRHTVRSETSKTGPDTVQQKEKMTYTYSHILERLLLRCRTNKPMMQISLGNIETVLSARDPGNTES